MAKKMYVDKLKIGDLIVFTYAGAYAWNISHHDFLRHPHPEFLYIEPPSRCGEISHVGTEHNR